jgi:bifunctional UDP-N-acetylglucosamine pyrophosphorylase/glucosamine-1-phosphate N-acetyltransferase
VTAPTVVILAAGQGTRMRSRTPKMLHDLCGRPLIGWTVAAAREAGAGKVVVVGGTDRALEDALPPDVVLAVQPRPDGTGGAVLAAAEHLRAPGPVLILIGDAPLITPEALRDLLDTHARSGAAGTVLTMTLDDPARYGRVVRDAAGGFERIVEAKSTGDATPAELEIREVNSGIYAFEGPALLDALAHVGTDNAQGEIYLPEALTILREAGERVAVVEVDPSLTLGVNDRVELAAVRKVAQRRIHEAHMRAGVTIVDPDTTTIDVGVRIGRDTVVEPSTFLRGATAIGEGCTVGPLTTAIDAVLGDDVSVVHSYLNGCELRAGATVGPFAYLRPGALLRERAKAGTFVEIKNSDIGEGTKVPHLSYVGDTDVGPGTNLGAATITANYDGRNKHRTTIGANVRTSVDTTLVAPVRVGDDAYTGAGSVVTDDVPPGALAIARARQTNIEDYAERRRTADAQPS